MTDSNPKPSTIKAQTWGSTSSDNISGYRLVNYEQPGENGAYYPPSLMDCGDPQLNRPYTTSPNSISKIYIAGPYYDSIRLGCRRDVPDTKSADPTLAGTISYYSYTTSGGWGLVNTETSYFLESFIPEMRPTTNLLKNHPLGNPLKKYKFCDLMPVSVSLPKGWQSYKYFYPYSWAPPFIGNLCPPISTDNPLRYYTETQVASAAPTVVAAQFFGSYTLGTSAGYDFAMNITGDRYVYAKSVEDIFYLWFSQPITVDPTWTKSSSADGTLIQPYSFTTAGLSGYAHYAAENWEVDSGFNCVKVTMRADINSDSLRYWSFGSYPQEAVTFNISGGWLKGANGVPISAQSIVSTWEHSPVRISQQVPPQDQERIRGVPRAAPLYSEAEPWAYSYGGAGGGFNKKIQNMPIPHIFRDGSNNLISPNTVAPTSENTSAYPAFYNPHMRNLGYGLGQQAFTAPRIVPFEIIQTLNEVVSAAAWDGVHGDFAYYTQINGGVCQSLNVISDGDVPYELYNYIINAVEPLYCWLPRQRRWARIESSPYFQFGSGRTIQTQYQTGILSGNHVTWSAGIPSAPNYSGNMLVRGIWDERDSIADLDLQVGDKVYLWAGTAGGVRTKTGDFLLTNWSEWKDTTWGSFYVTTGSPKKLKSITNSIQFEYDFSYYTTDTSVNLTVTISGSNFTPNDIFVYSFTQNSITPTYFYPFDPYQGEIYAYVPGASYCYGQLVYTPDNQIWQCTPYPDYCTTSAPGDPDLQWSSTTAYWHAVYYGDNVTRNFTMKTPLVNHIHYKFVNDGGEIYCNVQQDCTTTAADWTTHVTYTGAGGDGWRGELPPYNKHVNAPTP